MFSRAVDVLVADLADVVVDEDLLSISELGRALQFGSPASLTEYLAVHTWIRRRLAEYLDFPAADIRLAENEHGKPVIATPTTDLSFNLAYGGQMAVLAVGFRSNVGVDIERIKGKSVDGGAAQEKMAVLVADGMETAYLRQWVRNQSLGKATGHGLEGNMGTIDLSADSPVTVDGYEITDLNLGPGYVAAVSAPEGSTIAISIVVSEPAQVEEVTSEPELESLYLSLAGVGS
jgi:4'-phosphopantetheinyl transferase